jgi:hypothetical protein
MKMCESCSWVKTVCEGRESGTSDDIKLLYTSYIEVS